MPALLLALALSTVTALQPAKPSPAPPAKGPAASGPNAALVAKLKRGVNLSHWWTGNGGPDRAPTPAVINVLRLSGVTHVRIPVDPARLMQGKERLNPAVMMELTRAVDQLARAGMGVVITVRANGDDSTAMQPARNPEAWEQELTAFWTLFAPAWKQHPPEFIAFELLSEPNGIEDKEWAQAQERLCATVRSHLPRHTVVLTGADWGSIDGLLKLTPARDANALYTFHFYEPHAFTHQQATWGAPLWKEIKGLAYPFNAANADAALAATTDPKAQGALRLYAREKWSASVIKARFDKAREWAARHNAKLYVGEFGAYRSGGDAASRAAWLKDVRLAAEGIQAGWCVWDYSGGYAISERAGPQAPRRPDAEAFRALGLAPPQR